MDIHITPKELIDNLRNAFGKNFQLPLAFWYSDTPIAQTQKTPGCLFKTLNLARQGIKVTLHKDNISCGGGKFYLGFSPFLEHIPNFVSKKEKYKKTPELVLSYIKDIDIGLAKKPYLNFSRIDSMDSLEYLEGLLFYAKADVLSGLTSWAYYDNNVSGAVCSPFGSGCSQMILMARRENLMGGNKTFLGLFDPSIRPYVGKDELGFLIPRCRFLSMQDTLKECCLNNTHAWNKVKERILEKE